MLSIHNNTLSLSIQNQLSRTNSKIAQSTQRISTGFRINSAKDDAAGLAISSRLESQIRGMSVAVRNTNDAISVVQTAESSFGNATEILQQMRELTVSASNSTLSDAERTAMNTQYQSLKDSFEDVFAKTTFNGKKILAGDAGAMTFQIGANSGDTLTVTTTAGADLIGTHGDLTSAANAATAMAAMDTAIEKVGAARTGYGSTLNRLDYVVSNLETSITNTSDARSRIMDTDYAQEISKLTASQMLQQAGTAMLSQANTQANLVLSLLK